MSNIGNQQLGDIILGASGEEGVAEVYVHGQAQAWIEQTYYKHGQSQAQIKQTYYQHGQAQALIGAISLRYSQAQGTIKNTYNQHGQTQTDIKQIYFGLGQAQALIKNTYNQHGQAQARIKQTHNQHGQTQADINSPIRNAHGQAIGLIAGANLGHAQAQAHIENSYGISGQARAFVIAHRRILAQAQANIEAVTFKFGQALALISHPLAHGQARAFITGGPNVLIADTFTRTMTFGDQDFGFPDIGPEYIFEDAQFSEIDGSVLLTTTTDDFTDVDAVNPIDAADIVMVVDFKMDTITDFAELVTLGARVNLEELVRIRASITYDADFNNMFVQIQDTENPVDTTLPKFDDDTWYTFKFSVQGDDLKARVWKRSDPEPGTWLLETTYFITPGEGAIILDTGGVRLQAELGTNLPGEVNHSFDNFFVYGVSSPAHTFVSGQSQAFILPITHNATGQTQTFISRPIAHGQANADIKAVRRGHAQARARIIQNFVSRVGQAQAKIMPHYDMHGNAQGYIRKPQPFGQAQARITAFGQRKFGQAQARILATAVTYAHGQTMGAIKGPATGQAAALIAGGTYLIRYNGFNLPGYAQQESIDSISRMQINGATYVDGSLSQYMGLENKMVSIRMKAVDSSYLGVKLQAQKATTILHSKKTFTKLYIQYWDRYFEALTKKVSIDKNVRESMRVLDYTVEFEAKPWITSEQIYTVSGIGLINTDIIGRDLSHGGWTPATLRLDGTNITISGYTATGEFAGFISISGAVSNFEVTSNYTTTDNSLMYNADYIMYVGPGKTFFQISGATSCTISWQNRWYL